MTNTAAAQAALLTPTERNTLASRHLANTGVNLDTFFGGDRAGGGTVDLHTVPLPAKLLLGMLGLIVAGVKLRKYA